ncbi:MAG: hypothetical protein WC728_13510 [Elusimicrobiota bacterium]
MKQCEAKTLSSTYSETHRCLKSTGLKKIGKRYLCAHHRSMQGRRKQAQ